MIGVYATVADAEAAIVRLRVQPGFRDWPEGFSVDPYEVGVDEWREGFVCVVPVLVPLRSEYGAFEVNQAVWRPGDIYELGEIEAAENSLFSEGDRVYAEERDVPGYGARALVVKERVRNGE